MGVWSTLRPGRFTPGKEPVPIVQEAGCTPGPFWTGAGNLAPTPEFDPRTVQALVSRYTEWTTLYNINFLISVYLQVLSQLTLHFNNIVLRI